MSGNINIIFITVTINQKYYIKILLKIKKNVFGKTSHFDPPPSVLEGIVVRKNGLTKNPQKVLKWYDFAPNGLGEGKQKNRDRRVPL